mmetsp:Transcript_34463/g.77712  ORF Transcript_34463/g.77712 Transcript_34463/m.77712 type:complete len:268 (+) Transcript_34463:325-1128(+)
MVRGHVLLVRLGHVEGTGPKESMYVVVSQHLILQQLLRQQVELLSLLVDQIRRPLVRVGHNRPGLLVDHLRRRLTVGLLELTSLPILIRQRPDLVVHPVDRHLLVRDLRHSVKVVRRARCDAAKDDLLGYSAAKSHAHHVEQLLLGVERRLTWEELVVTESAGASRNDRNLQERVGILQEPPANGMTGLVVCYTPALLLGQDFALLLNASYHSLDSGLEVCNGDLFLVAPSSNQGCFVADICDVSSCKTRSQRCHALRDLVDIVRKL